MPQPPTMKEILARYKIPEDRLDKKISDEHILLIAKFIDHAEMGPELGLTPQQMSDIEAEVNSSENVKRITTLRKWRERFSFNATYRELIKALLKCEKNEQAESVCSMLSDHEDASPGCDSGVTEMTPSPVQMDCPNSTEDQPGGDNEPDQPAGDDQNQVLQEVKAAEFIHEMNYLEVKFENLIDKTVDDLKGNKVDLAKVKRSIFKPRLFDTHTDAQPCLDEHFNEITKAESIDSLFMLISHKKIWTVLSPALLQRVVNQCGSNTVQDEMKQFMEELCQLRKKTRLKEYAQVCGMPVDGCILEYKMGKEWEEKTLEDVEILRRQHEHQSVCMQIVGAKEGSMILLWRVPFPSHKAIIHQIPNSFFEENDVKKVTLDGVTLFDSESLPQSTEEIPGAISSNERIGQKPIATYYPPIFHEGKEQKLLLEIKRMKGMEGKVPTRPVGEHYVEFRGVQYNMKYGGVGGNTSEAMILVSAGDEMPADVMVKLRFRDAQMAERAISKYGHLPNIVTGLHDELAADIMARVSLTLQDVSSDLVNLYIDSPGNQRSREYYLEKIEEFFGQCQKPLSMSIYCSIEPLDGKDSENLLTMLNGSVGSHRYFVLSTLVRLIYLGHGEKGTGNWCFKDGTISFQDIFDCYRRKFPQKGLSLETDCSHSGQWINDCARVLDNFAIAPCGHKAREQGVLIKVFASCMPDETAVEPCYSVEGIDMREDGTQILYTKKKVNDAVTFCGCDFTRLTCCRGPDKPCVAEKALKNYTWELAINGGLKSRVSIIQGKDRGKSAWHIVLLSDTSEAYKKRFHKTLALGNIDVADWGYIIQSGWGKDPPQDVSDKTFRWMSI